MLKRSSKPKGGQHPVAFKLKAIKRVQRGEGVSPVARDLDVRRKALHDWLRAFKALDLTAWTASAGPSSDGGA